jgi:predicted nucleic acid-binding protein
LIAYADTGFLMSLYGQDNLSAEADALVKSRPVFALTPLGATEFMNAVELRIFRKEWTRREADSVRATFERHQAAGTLRRERLSAETWELAAALSRRHSGKLGTRTLDVVHVASAILLKAAPFYTFDERQRRLAAAERLVLRPG